MLQLMQLLVQGVVIICITLLTILFVKFCRWSLVWVWPRETRPSRSIVSRASLSPRAHPQSLVCETSRSKLKLFFDSFNSNSPPTILNCRLKTHQSGTPQAFFLVKWKSDLHNLHLHFSSFKYTVEGLELTGVSHVDAMPSLGTGGYKEVGHKETIVKYKQGNEHTEQWQHFVKTSEASIKKQCMEFVTANRINWKDKQCWKMQNSVPP